MEKRDRPELRLPAAGDAVLPSISRLMLHFGNIRPFTASQSGWKPKVGTLYSPRALFAT